MNSWFRSLALVVVLVGALGARTGDTDDERARLALRVWAGCNEQSADSLAHQLDCLRSLTAIRHPRVLRRLVEFLAQCDLVLRPTVRAYIASTVDAGQRRLVAEYLADRSAAVREHVALALAESDAAWPDQCVQLHGLLDDPVAEVRAAAVDALGANGCTEVIERLSEIAHSDTMIVRRRIPRALRRVLAERSVSAIQPMLHDQSWRVRCAAARELGRVESWSAARALVRRIGEEQGRVLEEILASLVRLSGRDYGTSEEAWSRWIEFRAAPGSPQGGAAPPTPGAAGPAGSAVTVDRDADGARYYGITTRSRRLLLVVDVSSSMDGELNDDEALAVTHGATLLDVATKEVGNLVTALEDGVAINLLSFASQISTWRSTLVALNAGVRVAAESEVRSWNAGGETNLFAALEHVFDLAEADCRAVRRASERAPDTVFLLSDAEPTRGDLTDIDLLQAYVEERNRDADLKLHCISFFPRTDLLREIAAACDGEYVVPLDF